MAINRGAPYIILAGQLEVSVQAMAQHTIAQLASGEVVGEMSFVDGLPPRPP